MRNKIDYSLAIFGKPNVGKSTFLNTLLGYERSFTNSVAGTTSDYVTEMFLFINQKIYKFLILQELNTKSKY